MFKKFLNIFSSSKSKKDLVKDLKQMGEDLEGIDEDQEFSEKKLVEKQINVSQEEMLRHGLKVEQYMLGYQKLKPLPKPGKQRDDVLTKLAQDIRKDALETERIHASRQESKAYNMTRKYVDNSENKMTQNEKIGLLHKGQFDDEKTRKKRIERQKQLKDPNIDPHTKEELEWAIVKQRLKLDDPHKKIIATDSPKSQALTFVFQKELQNELSQKLDDIHQQNMSVELTPEQEETRNTKKQTVQEQGLDDMLYSL